jgi:hypothetical protein
MLYISNSGLTPMYIVTNDEGLMLLYTSNSKMARYVNEQSKGIDPDLRLRIGGDKGTKAEHPLWHHVRKFNRWQR